MAINHATLADEDGAYPDWIEVFNAGTNTVSLDGWFLTDTATNPTKWRFPATNLNAGGYLVVFASNKDRRVPGAPLHTDFQLSGGGEYLALVRPDGTNVASAYAPSFPPQVADVSFGIITSPASTNESPQWYYFPQPTPGAPNRFGVTTLGAIISDTSFFPTQPAATNNLMVTARVRQTFDTVTNVTLLYRVMFSNEVAVPMLDDGLHGDGVVGDGVFGAAIPAGVAAPGQMVRWAITASDTSGTLSRYPLAAADLRSPEYLGTVVALASNPPLPVIQIFIEHTNWYALPNGCYSKLTNTSASIYWAGQFYDNVSVRIRGASSVVWKFPKQSLQFDFNPGYRFLAWPDYEPVKQVDVNEFWTDKAYIRNYLSMMEAYQAVGAPAPKVSFLLNYLNGSWHSTASMVEEPDEIFLHQNGLDPNGALYKMFNNLSEATVRPIVQPCDNPDSYAGAEKKTRQSEDYSDLQALVNGIKSSNPNRTAFLFDNLNVPEIINYLAASLLTQDWDRYPKNHFVYRDSDGTGEWRIFPWDGDLSWGYAGWFTDEITANHPTFSHPLYGESDFVGPYGQWHVLADALYRTPVFRQMFLRRARSVLDQVLQAPGTPTSQLRLEARLDALQTLLGSTVDADKQQWGLPFGTNQTFQQAINVIKTNYLAPRRTHLFVTQGPPNGFIPSAQPAYPALRLAGLDFNPASGNQAEEYFCLTNPTTFAVDLSGWQITGGVSFTFKPGTVIASNSALYVSPDVAAFRRRASGPRGGQSLFVVGGYQGQLSAWGETLRLVDTSGRTVLTTNYAGSPSLAQQFLRITEIMYNPPALTGNTNDAQQFEYLELKNISSNVTLDLTHVRLTNGVSFDFTGSAITSLSPGGLALIVRDTNAFVARYGAGRPIAGVYQGHLANTGETLRLEDASGEKILEFAYDNTWYPVTDGLGFSLVIADESASWDTWGDKARWRPSGALYGSPGAKDPAPPVFPPVVVNEVLSSPELPQVGAIELFNPTGGAVNLSGWFLSDDLQMPKKYRIPDNTFIAGGGFVVFTEADFNPVPGMSPSFALNSAGGQVALFSGDALMNLTGYYHGFSFGAADRSVSFGRYVNSQGAEDFVAQSTNTFGASNAYPKVGPAVISEIMYHPADSGTTNNTRDEYLELQNITTDTLPFFDPAIPTNTWRLRNAVDFDFPTNISLPPGGRLLVIGFDPVAEPNTLAAFRATYALNSGLIILGPWSGHFNNGQNSIELKKPGAPVGANVPFVMVEKITCQNSAPWPGGADGWGLSVQRLNPLAYGDDPTNWSAAPPTPGVPSSSAGATPVILVQPSSLSVTAFTAVALSVSAIGAPPLNYQWGFNGHVLSGATNATLLFTNVLLEQAGVYQVAVFNAAGSVLSSNVMLTVKLGPMITQQPTNQTIKQGSTATFTVSAQSGVGTPLRYQWRQGGVDLPGRTNATLTLTNVQTSLNGIYSVLVSDDSGTIVSASVTLTVVFAPGIAVQPVNQSVPAGGNVTFSILLTNGSLPINYQWRLASTPLTNFLLNSYSSFFTVSNVQAAQAGNYRVVMTNIAMPGGYASSTATLTVLSDTDKDGIPDAWTQLYFGHATGQAADLSRAGDDADGDGMSNWAEYIAGTIPTNALSYLRVEPMIPGSPRNLQFLAVSNRTYSIERIDRLGSDPWLKLADVVARTNSRLETVVDPQPVTNRFYRLVTPWRP